MNESKKKDGWDIFSTVSTFISSVILVAATYFITHCYQQKQQKIDNNFKKIELLEKLMPSLSSRDTIQNKAAILVLYGLGYDTLACNIATLLNSPGSKEALQRIRINPLGSNINMSAYLDKIGSSAKPQDYNSVPPTIPDNIPAKTSTVRNERSDISTEENKQNNNSTSAVNSGNAFPKNSNVANDSSTKQPDERSVKSKTDIKKESTCLEHFDKKSLNIDTLLSRKKPHDYVQYNKPNYRGTFPTDKVIWRVIKAKIEISDGVYVFSNDDVAIRLVIRNPVKEGCARGLAANTQLIVWGSVRKPKEGESELYMNFDVDSLKIYP